MSDHAWLDNIINTGQLPTHYGTRNDLRREIQDNAAQIEAIASSSSFRTRSQESTQSAGDGAEGLSTRRPHAAESRGSEVQDFPTEEEGTVREDRTRPHGIRPSAAVLEARREAMRADRARQNVGKHAWPVIRILERHLPVVGAAVRDYTRAANDEARAYRQYARALAADLAALEGDQ